MKLREWLREQPFHLAMSSGFFGFFAHAGIVTVLEEEGLVPSHVSGSSAGALVTGCWATGVSIFKVRDLLFSVERKDFWDPSPGLGFLRGKLFDELLRSFMPVTEFSKCNFPVSISVYDALSLKTKVITEGDLVLAIRASCAVPLLFHPVWIKSKPYWDGGIKDHSGLLGMPRTNRILYHHLLPRSHNNNPKHIQKIPAVENSVSLILTSLPSVGPYQLEQGQKAYQHAYEAMKKAMDMPIVNKMLL